jgi:hypothetical protein
LIEKLTRFNVPERLKFSKFTLRSFSSVMLLKITVAGVDALLRSDRIIDSASSSVEQSVVSVYVKTESTVFPTTE